MKKILTLLITLIIFSCNESPKENGKTYTNLIEKHINNEQVAKFLESLGSNYEFDDSYGRKFYIYKEKGVELNFTKTDTLKAIFFKTSDLSPEIELPLNIKLTNTRKELEKALGKPDKYSAGLKNLNAYYFYKDLVIKYKSKDTLNMNNGLENVSIQKLDKERILGTK